MRLATWEDAMAHGLSQDEWRILVEGLGRVPNIAELGVASALWSEHCSYKSSRVHLAKLPKTSPRVVVGPGENAGVVELAPGITAAFKVESHNHPSFIEPYQGAATGVGGILRDIFAMGARPVMLLDSLRFGAPDHPLTAHLVDGVVRGIAGYGNCMGIPTVGGELEFHPSFNGNILVNVMCVGVCRGEGARASAGSPGGLLVYIGSPTGRDGIHGATMASAAFDEDAEEKRPTVQVGDPFTGKILMECCLELVEAGLLTGLQDMGAAGLTSSSFEMASRSGVGMEINLDLVPTRAEGMDAYELMLSESQERMLAVVSPENEARVHAVCRRWGVPSVTIGKVVPEARVVAYHRGEKAVDMPVDLLVDRAPRLSRELTRPEPADAFDASDVVDRDVAELVKVLFSSPNVADPFWIWSQYDQTVGTDTVLPAGADAALLRIKGTDLAVAATIDGNSLKCGLDPWAGSAWLVMEAVANLSAVGATPLGITDCLNFGSPENPAIMGQFASSVDGLGWAATRFGLPVVSGNVSFYNETAGRSVLPTPTVGMVGVVEGLASVPKPFWREGDVILLARCKGSDPTLEASRLLQALGIEAGRVQLPDVAGFAEVADGVRKLVRSGVVSARDISDGGLVMALLEASGGVVGCTIELPQGGDPVVELFGESVGRFLLWCGREALPRVEEELGDVVVLGVAGGSRLEIKTGGSTLLNVPIEELVALRRRILPDIVGD